MSENIELDEVAKQERREYFRQWRANNKDKVKQHNANYWAKRTGTSVTTNQTSKEGEELKGMKIIFSEENSEYLNYICKVKNVSVSEIVNNAVDEARNKSKEVFEELKKILEKIN